MATTLNTNPSNSSSVSSSGTSSSFGKEGVYSTFTGKDAYGGSAYKPAGTGLEGQQQSSLGFKGSSTSLQQQPSLSLGSSQSQSSLGVGAGQVGGVQQQQLSPQQQQLLASKYSGNIQFGAIPGNVTSNYSIQRLEQNLDQQQLAQHKILWAGETGPISLQHKAVCLSQEPLMIKPEPIVVPQPPVVFQPDTIQIPQPPLMFQPEPIVIPLPPLTIQPEPVVIERPPIVIQPQPVVLRRPDIQMSPSFSLNLKYGCGTGQDQACVPAQSGNACPPGMVPASSVNSGASSFQGGNTGSYSGVGSGASAGAGDYSMGSSPLKNAARYEAATLTGSSGTGGSSNKM